jgi:hypothetical protein
MQTAISGLPDATAGRSGIHHVRIPWVNGKGGHPAGVVEFPAQRLWADELPKA